MSAVSNGLQRAIWDAIGIGASTLCAIYCVLLPFVLAFSPTLAHFLPGDEVLHRTLAYLLAAVGLVAFWAGYEVHRRKIVVFVLALGIAGVTVGAYAGSRLPSHRWEIAITLIGSSLLVLAHFMNRTPCRSCKAAPTTLEDVQPDPLFRLYFHLLIC